MRNRSIFKKIKKYVEDNKLNVEQVNTVTPNQVFNFLPMNTKERKEYKLYEGGIKTLLIRNLENEIDDALLADIRQKVHNELNTRFPKYQTERDFGDKKNRKIIIHLDGKQE